MTPEETRLIEAAKNEIMARYRYSHAQAALGRVRPRDTVELEKACLRRNRCDRKVAETFDEYCAAYGALSDHMIAVMELPVP